mgnify:FL=1
MSPSPRASARPRRATAAALAFLLALGVAVPLVGCGGQKPAEVAQASPPPQDEQLVEPVQLHDEFPDLSNPDVGLEPELPSVTSLDSQTEKLANTPVDVVAPPGLTAEFTGGLEGTTGAFMSGASAGGDGRSGATRSKLLSSSGGDAYNRLNAEQYGRIVDNAFLAARSNPLSTFSTDVNTASYSNVRRYLDRSKLPPKDAVFAAEFVNYFSYTYPQPAGADPVSMTTTIAPCPWQPKHHLVRIGLKAKDVDRANLPARNFVFLVDVSGSMEADNRLPLVKKSLLMLVDQLAAKDSVSIVTYASGTSLRLPATRGHQKAIIRSRITELQSGGGTNGEAGITLAYRQAKAHFIPGGENRVILCTDGDFNVGQTSDAELVRLIEQHRKSGVFLSVVGFGMGNLKDQKMKELANHGNGYHVYIDSEREARKVFVEQGAALVTVAKDVKLQVEFNPRMVTAYRLIGYENRLLKAEDFKDDTKDAAEMGSGHTVTAMYEVVPAGVKIDLPGVDPLKYQEPAKPVDRGSDEWLTVKFRYKAPDGDKSKEVVHPMPAADFATEMPPDFKFAAAVAEFAMLLRDTKEKGASSYDRVIAAAETCLDNDPGGHRKEFVELVRKAKNAPPRKELE